MKNRVPVNGDDLEISSWFSIPVSLSDLNIGTTVAFIIHVGMFPFIIDSLKTLVNTGEIESTTNRYANGVISLKVAFFDLKQSIMF